MIFADISSVESIARLAPRHIRRECGRHKPSRCHRLSVTDKRFSRQPAACLRKLSHIPGKGLGAASHLHNFAVELESLCELRRRPQSEERSPWRPKQSRRASEAGFAPKASCAARAQHGSSTGGSSSHKSGDAGSNTVCVVIAVPPTGFTFSSSNSHATCLLAR